MHAGLHPQTASFSRFPLIWLALTLGFLMIHLVPSHPVEQMLGEGAAPGQRPTALSEGVRSECDAR